MIILGRKFLNSSLIPAFIIATLYLAGCSDSENGEGITDVKKSVGVELPRRERKSKKII